MSGYLRPASICAGARNQPCTSNASLFQRTERASPQVGRADEFVLEMRFHSPMRPAQTSGALRNVLRMTAEVTPSFASDAPMTSWLVTSSSPCQSVSIEPLLVSTRTMADSPATFSPKVILSVAVQANDVTDAFRSGVTLRAAPPAAGMTNRSPPVEPSSLISPSMNAIDLPSGDQRGSASCNCGV